MGLHRAGFEVVGFDIEPQPNYPFDFVLQDALSVDLSGFDAVWASPPCQAYVQRNKNLKTKHPKLIEPIRERLKETHVPYIISNSEGRAKFYDRLQPLHPLLGGSVLTNEVCLIFVPCFLHVPLHTS